MKQSTKNPLFIFSFFITMLAFAACHRDPPPPPPPPVMPNYLQKENKKFPLDSAVVFYDSVSAGNTVFTLSLHNTSTDQVFIAFDYLLLQNTYELLPGTYTYRRLQSMQDMEANRFHDVVLKCESPVLNSFMHPVSQDRLTIRKTGNTYEIAGELVMNGKPYRIQFKGPVQHIKSW